MLKPKVEQVLGREVKLESVITSVKRVKADYRPPRGNIASVIARSVINIRTDVAKISVEKNNRTMDAIRKTFVEFLGKFFHVLEGISAITLIFDRTSFKDVYSTFEGKDILDKKQNLAAIMVHSPREIIDTPGCAIAFYNPVSRRGINIEETMSCFTDTIVVIPMEDVGEAFIVLTDLVAEARKSVGS
jgi:hypothetical protein